MEQIDESIKISIEEEPETSSKFKEAIYTLHTLGNYNSSGFSEHIQGKLSALIIRSNKLVHIKLSLENYPDVIIYEKKDYIGCYYLPIRITPVSHSGNQFNFNAEKFYLNDKIFIEVDGMSETDVEVVLRWEMM